MTKQETRFLDRYGRFVWGGTAALLLFVLLASFVMSGSSVSGAERDAQERAASLASSVVEEQLTPELLTRDIDGTDHRDLTVRVQAGILSDDRFEVVRIWRLDGGLIFSTAQRDDVNAVAAGDDPWIQQALGGRTVSVLSTAGIYHEGLKRPNEELFQTFIPIRLLGDAVVGVVQIDQRYGAIHNQAYRLWRPVQVVVLPLLVGAFVMLARTFRGGVSYGVGGVERRQIPGRRVDDLSVSVAVDRADQAERRVRETDKRVAELETQLARAPGTATAAAAIEELDLKLRASEADREELDLKLRASEADREELAGTVKRLRAELAESQAEVTLAREGSAGTRPEAKRVNKLITDAESKAVAAERKAAAAEQKAQDAAKRASVSAERGLELEAQLREAQKLAADVGTLSGGADEPAADAIGRLRELEAARVAFEEREDEDAAPGIGFGAEAELDARIAELEDAPAADVAPTPPAEPAPTGDADEARVPTSVPAADDPPAWDEVEDPFGDASPAFATTPDTSSDSPANIEEPVKEEPAEGPSLRERLARAAAARRRLS